MNRRQFLKALSSATAAIVVGRQVRAGLQRGERVNLLFIMTDQQRWDAMGCAGNTVIKTPNLDRLAAQGASFTKFYSSCPVCVPARTVILTGHGLEASQIRGNKDQDKQDGPNLPTFDQALLRGGYRGEYHGKWHSPYKFALDYTRCVRRLNGKNPPPGCKACRNPLLEGVKARPVRSGFLPPIGGLRPAGQPAKPARAGGRGLAP